MLLTCKNFKISDFTWKKNSDPGNGGSGGSGGMSHLPPPLSLSLRFWYSKKMHSQINRAAEARAFS